MYILGISAFYHDSAACLLKDGFIIAAAQEERFTRIKNDSQFPTNAIVYCLSEVGINLSEISHVVFYEKPFLKFERLVESFLATIPRGLIPFLQSMPIWIKEKIFQKNTIIKALKNIDKKWENKEESLLFTEHHLSHAASAFFPSPFENSHILTIDGVGEWATTSVWEGKGNNIKLIKEITFPHSVGLLYSAFTYYLGFKVNSDEYKIMGLAPYGKAKYKDLIFENLVDLLEDGSFKLNMSYFNYTVGLTMTNKKFDSLFGQKPRCKGEQITQFHMDVARSIQLVAEQIVLKIVKDLVASYQVKNLCIAGGVALNGVINGRILKESGLEGFWIQPASGDAGGAVGAALAIHYDFLQNSREVDKKGSDKMQNALLGPSFKQQEILDLLKRENIIYELFEEDAFYKEVANYLHQGKVIGWFNGRMEFGPRALGSRSIIADSRPKEMQSHLNLKVKFRESFRPFAPAILEEEANNYFNLKQASPYMLLVDQILPKHQLAVNGNLSGFDRLRFPHSAFTAVTHIDYSSRIQTVNCTDHPSFHRLIKTFFDLTGCPAIVNTSFNIKDQPIVCTPEDALFCFQNTNIDLLAFPGIIIIK